MSTWLGLRLQLLAAVLVTAVALLAAHSAQRQPSSSSIPGGGLLWRASRLLLLLSRQLREPDLGPAGGAGAGNEEHGRAGGPGMVSGLAALSLTYTLQVGSCNLFIHTCMDQCLCLLREGSGTLSLFSGPASWRHISCESSF